jgi:hypothetical protein
MLLAALLQAAAFDPCGHRPGQPAKAFVLPTCAGKYCRLVPVPTAPSLMGMQCDLDGPGSATPFQYTGVQQRTDVIRHSAADVCTAHKTEVVARCQPAARCNNSETRIDGEC